MKRRIKKISLMLTCICLTLILISGCKEQQSLSLKKDKENKAELKHLRVSVQKMYLSSPIQYILDHELDAEKGLKLDLVVAESGAGQIRKEQIKKWDIATIGGAFVYPIANDEAILIGELISSKNCNGIYAKKNSPVFDVKGFNPTYPNIFGNPDTVMNKDILIMPNTTSQYIAYRWLSSVGVRHDLINIISGDFRENYERAIDGKGDFASLTAPFSLMANEQDFDVVATAQDLNINIYEVLLANKSTYNEKQEEIFTFIKLLLEVNQKLESDAKLKEENVLKWYKSYNKELSEEEETLIKKECQLKKYVTAETYDIEHFGNYEVQYAKFLANEGVIKAQDLVNAKKNINGELFERAIEQYGASH